MLHDLARDAHVVAPDMLCPDVERAFVLDPDLSSVVVPLGDGAWHVLSRRRFSLVMAGPLGFGRALAAHRPVGAIAGAASPVLPGDLDLTAAGRAALDRPPGHRYDDVLVRRSDGSLATVVMVDLLNAIGGVYAHRAAHDELTGLRNRASFGEAVAAALAGPGEPAVLFVDLDDFKAVNDSLGHPAGDALLREVASRLREAFRAEDVIARLGGDEFAVLLADAGPDSARRAADRALLALQHPIGIGSEALAIRASVGIALAADAGDADALLRNADLAMYDAKRAGHGGAAPFRPELHERARTRLDLRNDLPHAIARDELRVHYQPIVELADGSVRGVEALVRWEHPVRGMIPPLEFLPLAEQSGTIGAIGAWVLRTACDQVVAWRAAHDPGLTVGVNVSMVQLETPGFAGLVLDALDASGLPADALTLEITESAFARETGVVVRALEALAAAGVMLAIDDFGTGYSSLARLESLPIGVLKLDRSFTWRVADGSTSVVRGMLGLASAMGLQVVVEGVETAEQATTLDRLGGSLAQGFLYSRPLTAEAMAVRFAASRSSR